MKAFVILVVIALAHAAVVHPKYKFLTPKVNPIVEVPHSPPQTGKIVGGTSAQIGDWPHQGYMLINGNSFCGCSIIGSRTVLSAGHCTQPANDATSIVVYVGQQTSDAVLGGFRSTRVTPHPQYGPVTLNNDVGLVVVGSDFPFSSTVAIGTLHAASEARIGDGVSLTATGWGKTSDAASSVSLNLNQVTRPSITNTLCTATYGSTIQSYHICIDTTGGQGTCNGDSGGPLNWLDGGFQKIVGVTSFVSSAGCQSGNPDGFTRTQDFEAWINANTGG